MALLLVWSVAPAVWAAAPAVTGRIELTTSEGCGSSEVLARRVAQRSPRVRLSPGGDGATVVRVTIGPGARKQTGSTVVSAMVAVQQGTAAAWIRRVDDVSCAEALDAVALILAVALDPERAAAEAEPSPPSRAPAPGRASGPVGGRRPGRAPASTRAEASPPPETDAQPTARAPAETAPTPPPAPPPPPPATNDARPPAETPPTKPTGPLEQQPPPPPPEPPVPSRPSVWWGAIGVIGAATTVPAKSVMPAVGAHVWLGIDRGSIWSPAARLTVSHFWASRYPTDSGTAHFTADLAAVDVCPLWQHGDNWGVGACAAITAGMVTARGTETFAPQTRHRPFIAPGATVAAAFEPLQDLQVTVWVNGAMPLIRDRFQFEPAVFYEVPWVSLTAGVGVGWRFW